MSEKFRPVEGIAVDAAHSLKSGRTQYQAVELSSGKLLFYKDLGNQTVNIGEFLGVVEAVRYIIRYNFRPALIFTDSRIALNWFQAGRTGSGKHSPELLKAEIYLRIMAARLKNIRVCHWQTQLWGEIPADFGNK